MCSLLCSLLALGPRLAGYVLRRDTPFVLSRFLLNLCYRSFLQLVLTGLVVLPVVAQESSAGDAADYVLASAEVPTLSGGPVGPDDALGVGCPI